MKKKKSCFVAWGWEGEGEGWSSSSIHIALSDSVLHPRIQKEKEISSLSNANDKCCLECRVYSLSSLTIVEKQGLSDPESLWRVSGRRRKKSLPQKRKTTIFNSVLPLELVMRMDKDTGETCCSKRTNPPSKQRGSFLFFRPLFSTCSRSCQQGFAPTWQH